MLDDLVFECQSAGLLTDPNKVRTTKGRWVNSGNVEPALIKMVKRSDMSYELCTCLEVTVRETTRLLQIRT